MFTVHGNIINDHMTFFADNVHSELLAIHTSGTTFHCKHVPVSSFAVQGIPFNVL